MSHEEAEKQQIHASCVEMLAFTLIVGEDKDGFRAYATTAGRLARLETGVCASRQKANAIMYALTELATMFEREGK